MDQHESATAAADGLDGSSARLRQEIARNLNDLFDQNRRADGRKHTNEEVADHVTEVTGVVCHRTWVSKLREARAMLEPARLDAVAGFFGRTSNYLRGEEDEDPTTVRELREIATIANALDAQGVRLRQLHDLDPEDLHLVRDLVGRLAAAQEQRRSPSD